MLRCQRHLPLSQSGIQRAPRKSRFQSSILITTSLSYIKVLSPKQKRKFKGSGSCRSLQYCFLLPERDTFTTCLENSAWSSVYSAMLDIVANCPAFLFPGVICLDMQKVWQMLIVEAKYMFSHNSSQFCDQYDNWFCGQLTAREFISV